MVPFVLLVVVAVVAFFIGMNYGKSKVTAANMMRLGGMNRTAQFGGMNGGGRGMGGNTFGQIISKDDKSMTISLPGGGSKIVFFGPSTKIMKSVDGTAADLVTGTTVIITGTPNTDGSINAESVQIRPAPLTP